MRIFFLSPNQIDRYNWGWQLFRNEIARQHEVVFATNGSTWGEFVPDIIMMGDPKYLGGCSTPEKTTLPKAVILGDYMDIHPTNSSYYLKRNNDFINKNKIDMVFAKTQYELEVFRESQRRGLIDEGVLGFLNHYSVDTNLYRNLNLKKYIDVCAIYNNFATWCYPERLAIKNMISGEPKWKVLIGDKKIGPIHHDYIEAINQSKIFINRCNIFSNLSWKALECLACGTFLLSDKPYDNLGLEDGEHLIYYDGLKDLKDKINFYLEDEDKRKKIAGQGMDYVRRHHSNEVRVREMTKRLEGLL